jgi:hypothetical protein
MVSPFIGGRIPQDLHGTLQKHITESGEKLTQVLQKALSNYLNYTPQINENETALERRIAILESSFRELREAFEQTHQSPQTQEEEFTEKDSSLPGQLSFLEEQNEDDINAEIPYDIRQNESDSKVDILPDIKDKNTSTSELEIITGEEMLKRTKLKIGTITIYYSQGQEVVREEFTYRPIREEKRRKKGEEMKWAVEPIS